MLLQITEPGESQENENEPHEIIAGIDLGTTNSLIAIATQDSVEIIEDNSGNNFLPSEVMIDAEGNLRTGFSENYEHKISSFKRFLGKSFADTQMDNNFGYKFVAGDNEKIAKIEVAGKNFSAVELSAEILKSLKSRAEKKLGKPVNKAVITVPAYFNDAQRIATKDAARIAGIDAIRLINEPTAAALAYGLDNDAEGIYAIYDLGGGTFDISLLKMQMGVFKVIATAGDTELGGDDFDISLSDLLKQKYPELAKIKTSLLKEQAKQIKESLSKKDNYKGEIVGIKIDISQKEFELAIESNINKTIDLFNNVIDQSEIETSKIKGVVLVGGSTRVPLVQQKIKDLTGLKPLTDIDPDQVVAIGAALQAEIIQGNSESLLIDVTPLTLGLETYGGLMEAILPRNTTIPATVTQKYTTYEDGQTAIKVHVLQGERELAENCRSLALFDLKGIPPKPAGTAVVEVTFMIDADGILTVSAKEEETGIEQKVEVKPSYGLNAEAMESMLITSMASAKQDIFARLLQEARVEADIVTRTIKTALTKDGELIDDDYRKDIEKHINIVKTTSQQDDREAIESAVKKLDELSSDFADLRISKALKGYLGGKNIEEYK